MNEKIGMYTEDEILEHLTEGEGRGFLGRSMYDAIFDKIHALKTEKEQLKQENHKYKEVIDKAIEYIKLLGKYDGQRCTRGFSMMTADFNKLLDILKEVE